MNLQGSASYKFRFPFWTGDAINMGDLTNNKYINGIIIGMYQSPLHKNQLNTNLIFVRISLYSMQFHDVKCLFKPSPNENTV